MRSYPCGKRQSLPRLRHARRSFCAIGPAAAISIIVHAGIHAVAKAERFDVFVSAVVRPAADSIDAAVACSPAADAVLCGTAADSVNWDTWLYCDCRNVQGSDSPNDSAATACAAATTATACSTAATAARASG